MIRAKSLLIFLSFFFDLSSLCRVSEYLTVYSSHLGYLEIIYFCKTDDLPVLLPLLQKFVKSSWGLDLIRCFTTGVCPATRGAELGSPVLNKFFRILSKRITYILNIWHCISNFWLTSISNLSLNVCDPSLKLVDVLAAALLRPLFLYLV